MNDKKRRKSKTCLPVPTDLLESQDMQIANSILKAASGKYGTILIDPPLRFANRTGKMAPEHKRLHRYSTMAFDEIAALPVGKIAAEKSHLYLWCPNALVAEALEIMKAWGFNYKTNIVWYKVRKDGGPDGHCVGFIFETQAVVLCWLR